jgi:hypothetical protein
MPTSSIVEKMHVLIHAWELQDDRRAIFLNCYAQMTRNMLLALDAGEFHSREWVSALLHHFADYYFIALENYDNDRPTPPLWQLTFDAAARRDTATIQNLFLGVNAHINYDLVLTVYDMLFPEWENLSPASRRSRYEDHTHVNEIIAETIDGVQDTVVERFSPAMDLVDRLLGPLDEWMTAKMIARWRENVWLQAVEMLEAPTKLEQAQVRGKVEKEALQLARLIAGF